MASLLLIFLFQFLVVVVNNGFLGLGLNSDGVLLLSLKYSVMSDPLSSLESWNYSDSTPCSWNGITCSVIQAQNNELRVTSLVLQGNQLLGSIPLELGYIDHLRLLDLSNNLFNGTIPLSLFSSTELETLSLANNKLFGKLPANITGNFTHLRNLNLSFNALSGEIPSSLAQAPELISLSLSNNFFSGSLPSGFGSNSSMPTEVLDFSSNLLNGSLPEDLGGNIQYLNLSLNRFSGEIPASLGSKLLENATLDLSNNNFTGSVPDSGAFVVQKPESFSGNPGLCGRPLKILCYAPATLSDPPPNSTTSPPAIAAIPNTLGAQAPVATTVTNKNGSTVVTRNQSNNKGLKPGAIAAIVVGDFAGLGLLAMVILYKYQVKKKNRKGEVKNGEKMRKQSIEQGGLKVDSTLQDGGHLSSWYCLRTGGNDREDNTSESTTGSSDTEDEEQKKREGGGKLVTVDGDTELELERLLKASAYILGASGSSIVYKAVLEDGSMLAVRRIGECGVDKMKDFEGQVRIIAKARHPNLVQLRGFYWGPDEKLLIYDYVPNGSLSSAFYGKMGGSSSPFHLPWEARLMIGKGVARGLAYLHEKKYVHGNLKPSNILLGQDLEPCISDFGLDRLVANNQGKASSSAALHFGSQRSTLSKDSLQSPVAAPDLLMSGSPGSSRNFISPYQAPETLKTLKPTQKWDVYSYGIVFLELITGKPPSEKDFNHWNARVLEEKGRALWAMDPALRSELQGKEEAVMLCLRIGFCCAASVPQKRPAMKEVLQSLEKIPSLPATTH
ncbi:probable LRR receptor-like serine/threonine-protein kinase At4g37250 [Amborella trichopoda]|uniref:Protein kinase domain-containing protein n=1 Tax=Amborella trichopoda TaxID=13333 RepID=W1PCM6_AMBTC|nr:probable LRR receptor-like serine/threonine-protein kinase At4g37250 [Amborella trichopoda]ERN05693.1 hypothetical protein AMTR_s00006p00212720 [Amborella trichopoda]|eukprot:XP_006844018.1 probable LRR receptor-like serine/threonine-protein kinase At4g37250 [Amborella trichopoda]